MKTVRYIGDLYPHLTKGGIYNVIKYVKIPRSQARQVHPTRKLESILIIDDIKRKSYYGIFTTENKPLFEDISISRNKIITGILK